jgi:hypothetical protein
MFVSSLGDGTEKVKGKVETVPTDTQLALNALQ